MAQTETQVQERLNQLESLKKQAEASAKSYQLEREQILREQNDSFWAEHKAAIELIFSQIYSTLFLTEPQHLQGLALETHTVLQRLKAQLITERDGKEVAIKLQETVNILVDPRANFIDRHNANASFSYLARGSQYSKDTRSAIAATVGFLFAATLAVLILLSTGGLALGVGLFVYIAVLVGAAGGLLGYSMEGSSSNKNENRGKDAISSINALCAERMKLHHHTTPHQPAASDETFINDEPVDEMALLN